jgi:L-alanine-DL-glutamate epimerase-like enolase superfamily enzyme
MSKPTDARVVAVDFCLLPVTMRMPLKFGAESVSSVNCVRVAVTVEGKDGRRAVGWGETPLSVTWAWPSATMTYQARFDAMVAFCHQLAQAWADSDATGHPLETGYDFLSRVLPELLAGFNTTQADEPMPHLAALIAASAFDLATHDAFGLLHNVDIYATYGSEYLCEDLSHYLTPQDPSVQFAGKYPGEFLIKPPAQQLPVWHLVGGLDPLEAADCSGNEPDDGYPVTLRQWIESDGLKCLKIKLRGNDADWDYQRLLAVGDLSRELGVEHLSADFNCTVTEPDYVNAILDRLQSEQPGLFDMLLYVEQPFPYDLKANQIDVHSVSQRKPLFLDESAHDWQYVALGRQLGWTGVALKTCKTQTGALLSLCWAKAHGMPLMVQDLTNPMLAQSPHVRLAAHAGTIMGVESNGMQFYPAASAPEAAVHPGLYQRQHGILDLSTLSGPGFGYRLGEIKRNLPERFRYLRRNS